MAYVDASTRVMAEIDMVDWAAVDKRHDIRVVLRGVPIASPIELRSGPEIIVIVSILHADKIAGRIRALGLRNRIINLTCVRPPDMSTAPMSR